MKKTLLFTNGGYVDYPKVTKIIKPLLPIGVKEKKKEEIEEHSEDKSKKRPLLPTGFGKKKSIKK